MNYEAILNKIEKYISNVDPDELIKSFENRGYEFVDIVEEDISTMNYKTYQPIDIGDNAYYSATTKKRASNPCSFFLFKLILI